MAVYKGIRYAHADRFSEPVMVPLPENICDAVCDEPTVCPQVESRLAPIFGKTQSGLKLSEDCLRLSIFTPEKDNVKDKDVLVFIHGGAFMTGSSELDVYSGRELAIREDIIVVTVSYRLGAFGYLFIKEEEVSNLGYKDQVCALRWIRKYINRFGGNSDRITVCGQSAGAMSVARMIAHEKENLMHKAIILSAPFGQTISEKKAAATTEKFLKVLAKDKKTASIDEILSAQEVIAKESLALPFCPTGSYYPNGTIMPGVEMIHLSFQTDDARAFIPAAFLTRTATSLIFRKPLERYKSIVSALGIKVSSEELSWGHDRCPFGAVHCMELPLLLGNWDSWKDAPMLKGISQEEFMEESNKYMAHIGAIVKS